MGQGLEGHGRELSSYVSMHGTPLLISPPLVGCAESVLPACLPAFLCVAEAYDVLSDPQKRAVYDRYGEGRWKNSS